MTTKLTLTIEKSVIVKAKSFARLTGRSLSEIVENYLETITKENKDQETSERLKSIVGSVKLPKDFNEGVELWNYFEKKHL
jgi:hypothetical protein